MPTQSLAIPMVVVALAMGSGCATGPPVEAGSKPATQPTNDWLATFYRFDDPRCSAEQQRAIRAATKAVIGTDQLPGSVTDRLHFSCTESMDGWSLTVWEFGPEEVPAPGGFTGVMLNRDFTVRSVVGGA